MMPARSLRPIGPIAAALALAGACDKPAALGEANSLILVADSALFAGLEEETYASLERTVFTIREERTFNVTHTTADARQIGELVLLKQVLVFATPEDPLLRQIVDRAGGEAAPGDIVQAQDVWARGQIATAVVLRPGSEEASWRDALPRLAEMLDGQYREYALSRMFTSGVDTTLSEALAAAFGVRLVAPNIYHGSIGDDGFIRLRNDNPTPADRIRSILIQRVPGVDSLPGPEGLYAWREGIDSVMYNVPQRFDRTPVAPRRFDLGGDPALEVRGVWQDEGTFPAAGPFIARAVRCADAMWYFDAWLYSPNARASKYEFVLQLEEILDSFRCKTS